MANFNNGNIDVPIDVDGFGETYEIMQQLELLRKNLLICRNKENKIVEENKSVVANITHDLKTPLALISGYAESLQDGMNDKDYLALIQEKTFSMNEMVLRILDSSKKDLTSISDVREKVFANDFFNEEFNRHQNLAHTKHINLTVKKSPNVELFIDKSEFSSVVQNLISNAIKFGKNFGKILVSFQRKNNFLQISVQDNGLGIDKDSLPFIFDKFYMADSSRNSANSGLGLYIVKEIVEKNGGTIECKSKVGRGTKFVFTVPIFEESKSVQKIENFLTSPVDGEVATQIKSKNKWLYFVVLFFCGPFILLYQTIVFSFVLFLLMFLIFLWIMVVGISVMPICFIIFAFVSISNGGLAVITALHFAGFFVSLGMAFLLANNIEKMSQGIVFAMKQLCLHDLKLAKRVLKGGRK